MSNCEYQNYLFELFKDYRPQPDYPSYPPYHSGFYLEEYFFDFIKRKPFSKNCFYIPVFWTNCYLSGITEGLQEKLDSLDPEREYFCVSQHDDAIKEKLPPKTKHFNAGGNSSGIPIPLICSPAPKVKRPKTTFCSFVGSVTHPLRQQMLISMFNKDGFELYAKEWTNTVTDSEKNFFLKKMAESRFTLCPRGYGATSFRLYEALQLGSIPVYIYDKPWIPFEDLVNWEEFCVMIEPEQINKIPQILESISDQDQEKMLIAGKKAWKKFFSLESCCKTIYNIASGRRN